MLSDSSVEIGQGFGGRCMSHEYFLTPYGTLAYLVKAQLSVQEQFFPCFLEARYGRKAAVISPAPYGCSYLQSSNCSTRCKPHNYGSRLHAHGVRVGFSPKLTRSLSPHQSQKPIGCGVRVWGRIRVGQSNWNCGILELVRQRLPPNH